MGIIINDTITLPSGLQVTGAYAGFGLKSITVTPIDVAASPTGKMYVVNAPYNIWVSNETRMAGADPLMVQPLMFTMGPDALMTGVYGVLYSKMCAQYTSTTNTDTPNPLTAAVAPTPSTPQPAASS